ncbi:MAG: histone deacetylase [Syntrophobacterales bacterium]|jgi:acetoin utilization deacetylase AcuC-like enzyme
MKHLQLTAKPHMRSAKTGLVYGEIYLKHDTGPHHPERPQRLTAIIDSLEAAGLLNKLLQIEPAPAKRSVLELCHKSYYIDEFKSAVEDSEPFLNTPECVLSPATFEVALCAVGGVLKGIDKVIEGTVRNCFCAVRPPGHHAGSYQAMGFCFFNNVAIAAKYLQKQHAMERIVVIDWDVHHGNGTQYMFDKDPTIYFVSFHQDPSSSYPGTGKGSETGHLQGKGFTQNFPMPVGAGEKEYRKALEEVEQSMEKFRPQFVLISAGFDAHIEDPQAHLNLTAQGYEELTRRIKGIAEVHAEGRLVSVLEGGYDLKALAESVERHIRVLLEG